MRICIAAAEYERADDDLFVGGGDPWCRPDAVDAERVIEVCEGCPSGALGVTDGNGQTVEQVRERNTIQVVNDGPRHVRGDLRLGGAPDDMQGVRHRVAL
jgi:uncharacterized Fe-S cluster protein YjdI